MVGPPTIIETFNPTTVAPGTNSYVTFTISNPSSNVVSLSGVSFNDTLPVNLRVTSAVSSTCTTGTTTGPVGATSISLTGAVIAAGASCMVSAAVTATPQTTYPNTTGAVTASNSNSGGTASATLTVIVSPTKLVDTSSPASPITAGGNGGSVAVSLEDNSGNIASTNSSSSVTLTVTGPGSYSQTYTATASNGTVTFNLSSVALTVAGT